jgi:UDP-glucose 4-epimerase|tara:strand:+ start:856 stop:1740 length:885 start_codon:yes stop_codon:yes gene_type:complete
VKKEIIFLGGSGFVGSYFVKRLIQNKYKVIIYDLNKPNFQHKNLKYVHGNILDIKKISKIIKKGSTVFNFAGWADLETASKNIEQVKKLNIKGNNDILKICEIKKVKRFIYASTLYVFSKYGGIYKETKKKAERIIENSKIPFTILRFGSLYGPGSKTGNAIYDILKMAIINKKIIYWGNGDEVRQYIHARDAAKVCDKILTNEYKNESLLITGLEDIRMRDLLNMIKEMFDNKVELTFDYNKRTESHYKNTPFTIMEKDNYIPKIGEKLLFDSYTDIGQGVYELANFLIKNRE